MQVATMEGETDMVVKRLSVPIGLEELMESLTKEVLRRKPSDIYAFASQHFAQLLEIRDQGNARGSLRKIRKSNSQISKSSEDTKVNTNNPVKVKSATFGTMTKMPMSKSPAPKAFLTRKNVPAKVESNISPRTIHNNNKNSRQEKTKMLMDKRRAVKKKSIDEKNQIELNKQPVELESRKMVQVRRKSDNSKIAVDQRRRSVNQTANEEKRLKDNSRSRSTSTNREGDVSKIIVDKSKRKTEQTRKIEEGRRKKSSSKSEEKLEKMNIDTKSASKESASHCENMEDLKVLSSNMSDISDSVVTQMERQEFNIEENPSLDGGTQKEELHPSISKDIEKEISGFDIGYHEESEASLTKKQDKSSMGDISVSDDNKDIQENQSENSDVSTVETDKISDTKIGLIISNITAADVTSDKSQEKDDLNVDAMNENNEDDVQESKQNLIHDDTVENFLAKTETDEQTFQETTIGESNDINIKNDNDSENIKIELSANEQNSILIDDIHKGLQETVKGHAQDTIMLEENETNLKNDGPAEKSQDILTTNEKDFLLNDDTSKSTLETIKKDIEEEQHSIATEINIKNDNDIGSLQLVEDNTTTIESLEVGNNNQNILKDDIFDITKAVTKIQALVRGHLTRKAIKQNTFISAENVDDFSNRAVTDSPIGIEGIDPQSTTVDQIKAATKIQSLMRGYLARKLVNRNQLQVSGNKTKKVDEPAIKSEEQVVVVNSKPNEVEVEILLEKSEPSNDGLTFADVERYTTEEIAAVTKIQALTRGHISRKSMNINKPTSPKHGEEVNEVIILAVDKSESRNDERNNDAKFTEDIEDLEIANTNVIPDISSPIRTGPEPMANQMDINIAASKIQALTRGHLTRKAINKNKNNNHFSDEIAKETLNIEDQPSKSDNSSSAKSKIKNTIDATRAAVVIQALVKGFLARRKIKKSNQSLTKSTNDVENESKFEQPQADVHENINYKDITSNFLGLEHIHYESSRYDDSTIQIEGEATEPIVETEKLKSAEYHKEEEKDDSKYHKESESTRFNIKEPFGDDVGPKPSNTETLADVSNYMKSETIIKPMETKDLQTPSECDELPHQRNHTIAEDAMKAATLIQALFRGYMIRKRGDNTESRLAKKKTYEEKLPTVLEVEDEDNRDSAQSVDSASEKLPSDAIEKIEVQISSEEPYLLSDNSNSANLQKNKILSDDEVFAILKQLDDTPVPTEEPRRKPKTYSRSFTIDEPSIQHSHPLSKSMTYVIGDEFQSFDTVDSADQSLKSADTDIGSISIDSTDSNIADITTAIKEDVQKLKRTLENGLEMEKIASDEGTVSDGNITEITKGISDDVKQLEKTLSQDFVVEKANLVITSNNPDRHIQDLDFVKESEEFLVRPLSKDSVTSTDSVDTVIFNDNLRRELVSGKEITSDPITNVDDNIESKHHEADKAGLNSVNWDETEMEQISEEIEQMNVAKEQSDILVNDILDTAAKKIESLEQTSPDLVQELTAGKRQSTTSDELRQLWQDEAATTIQKNYKGYRVRRDLDNQKQEMFQDKKYKEELADREITRYLSQITEPVRRAFSAEKHDKEDESDADKMRALSVDISKPDIVYIPLRDYSEENPDRNAENSHSYPELAQNMGLHENENNETNVGMKVKSNISEVLHEEVFVKESVKELGALNQDYTPDNQMDKRNAQVDPNSGNISIETKTNKESEDEISSYITAMVEPIKKTFELGENIEDEPIVENIPEPVSQYIPLRSYSEDDKINTVTAIDDNVVTSMSTLKDDIDTNISDMKVDDEVIILNKFEEIASEALNKDANEETISEEFESIATKTLNKNVKIEETTADVINNEIGQLLNSDQPTQPIVVNSEESSFVCKTLNTDESDKVIVKSDSLQLNPPTGERYVSKEIDEYINSLIEPVKQKFSPYKEKTITIEHQVPLSKVDEPVYKYIPLRDYSEEEIKNEIEVTNDASEKQIELSISEKVISDKSLDKEGVDVERKILDVEKLSTKESVHFLEDTNLTDHKFQTDAAMVNEADILHNSNRLEEDVDDISGKKKEADEIPNGVQEATNVLEKSVEASIINNKNLKKDIQDCLSLGIADESNKLLKETFNEMDNTEIVNHFQKSEQINDLKEVTSDISTSDKIINQVEDGLDGSNASKILEERRHSEDNINENSSSEAIVTDDVLKYVSSQDSSEADQNTSTGDELKTDDLSVSTGTSESQMENIIKIEIKDKVFDDNISKLCATEQLENLDESTHNLTDIDEEHDKSAVDDGKTFIKELENGDSHEIKMISVNPEISKANLENNTLFEEDVQHVKSISEKRDDVFMKQEESNRVKRNLLKDEIKSENKSVELEKETYHSSPEPVFAPPNSKNDNIKEKNKGLEVANDEHNTNIKKVSEDILVNRAKQVLSLNEPEDVSLNNVFEGEKIHETLLEEISGDIDVDGDGAGTNTDLEIKSHLKEKEILEDYVISQQIPVADDNKIKVQASEDNAIPKLPESEVLIIKQENEAMKEGDIIDKDTSIDYKVSDARIEKSECQIEDVLEKINNTASSDIDNTGKLLSETQLSTEDTQETKDTKLSQDIDNKECINNVTMEEENKKTEKDNEISKQLVNEASNKEDMQNDDEHEMLESENKPTNNNSVSFNKQDIHNEGNTAFENKEILSNLESVTHEDGVKDAIDKSKHVNNVESKGLDTNLQHNQESRIINDASDNNKSQIPKQKDNILKNDDDTSSESINNNILNEKYILSDTKANTNIIETPSVTAEENVNDLPNRISDELMLNSYDNETEADNSIDHVSHFKDVRVSQPVLGNVDIEKDSLATPGKEFNSDELDGFTGNKSDLQSIHPDIKDMKVEDTVSKTKIMDDSISQSAADPHSNSKETDKLNEPKNNIQAIVSGDDSANVIEQPLHKEVNANTNTHKDDDKVKTALQNRVEDVEIVKGDRLKDSSDGPTSQPLLDDINTNKGLISIANKESNVDDLQSYKENTETDLQNSSSDVKEAKVKDVINEYQVADGMNVQNVNGLYTNKKENDGTNNIENIGAIINEDTAVNPSGNDKNSKIEVVPNIEDKYVNKVSCDNNLQIASDLQPPLQETNKMVDSADKTENMDTYTTNDIQKSNLIVRPKYIQSPDVLHEELSEKDGHVKNITPMTNTESTLANTHPETEEVKSDDYEIEAINSSPGYEEKMKEESRDHELRETNKLQNLIPTEMDANQVEADVPKNKIEDAKNDTLIEYPNTKEMFEGDKIKESDRNVEVALEDQYSEKNKGHVNALVSDEKASSVNVLQTSVGGANEDAVAKEFDSGNLDFTDSKKVKADDGEFNNKKMIENDVKEQSEAVQEHESSHEPQNLQFDNDTSKSQSKYGVSDTENVEQTTDEKITSDPHLVPQHEGNINGKSTDNQVEGVLAAKTELISNEIPDNADKTSPFYLHQDLFFQNTPSIAQEKKFSEALRLSTESDKQTDSTTETSEQLLHSGEYHDSIPVNIMTDTSQKFLDTETNGVQCNIGQERTIPTSTVLVHSGELHDNILPLTLQMNQDPAGIEIVTSPSKFHKSTDGDAQASAKDVSERLGNTKTTRAQSEPSNNTTSMDSERRNNSTIIKKNVESQAATKIQASFRGYQVRKKLKNKLARDNISNIKRTSRRRSSGRITDTTKSSKKQSSTLEEQSATKIQAGVRGFLVRRRQKKNKSHSESS